MHFSIFSCIIKNLIDSFLPVFRQIKYTDGGQGMSNMENQGIWEKIQNSVKETERLMGQKKYNLSMIKARQTMEFMVKLQCDKSGIVESNTEICVYNIPTKKKTR